MIPARRTALAPAESPTAPDDPQPDLRGVPGSSCSPAPLLSVCGLSRSYGSTRRAVRDVSLELSPGVTGLLGPNGAGKSSLLACLAGIAGWDCGEIRIGGVDLARFPNEARKRVGFMPERVAFPPEMRVEEYLRFVCLVKRIPRRERCTMTDGALSHTGLENVRDRIIGNLSKGFRQRVGLAQALLGDPPVVLLDEPTAGLDPLSMLDIREQLRAYAAERAVLVSTHHLPEARLMCDRVVVLAHGSVVYNGSPSGLAAGRPGVLQVRLRLRGPANAQPPSLVEGTTLVHHGSGSDEEVLVVNAEDEQSVGALVRSLARERLIVSVEPTTDVLEEAFRIAVLGGDTRGPEEGE